MENIVASLIIFLLPLPLLMPRIRTDNQKAPVALNVLAVHANFFY